MVITIALEAMTGRFDTDIQRSTRAAERDIKRMRDQSRRALRDFGRIVAAAGAAAAAGLAVMVRGAIRSADELAKNAQRVGVSVESLQRLGYAAELGGASMEILQRSLVRLSASAVEAQKSTSAQRQAFDALGISVKNTDGTLKSNEQLLNEIADAFARTEDGAAKTAAAVAIFGRSGAQLIPTLNQGSAGLKALGDEFESFGGLISKETAQAAEQFNDNLSRVGTAASALASKIAAELLPDLIRLSDQFVAFVQDGDRVERVARSIGAAIDFLIRSVTVLANAFQIVGNSFGATFAAIAAAIKGDFSAVLRIFKELDQDVNRDVEQLKEAIFGVSDAATAAGDSVPKAAIAMAKGFAETNRELLKLNEGFGKQQLVFDAEAAKKQADAVKAAADETERAITSLKNLEAGLKQQAETAGLSGAALLEYRLKTGDLSEALDKAGEAGKAASEGALAYQRAIDEAAEEQENFRKRLEADSEQLQEINHLLARHDEFITGVDSRTRQYLDTLADLQRLYELNAISADELSHAIARATETFSEFSDESQKALREQEAAVRAAAEETERAVTSLRNLEASLKQQVETAGLAGAALLEYRLTVGDLSEELNKAGAAGREAAEGALAYQRILDEAAAEQAHFAELLEMEADQLREIGNLLGRHDEIITGVDARTRQYLNTLEDLHRLHELNALSAEQLGEAIGRATEAYIKDTEESLDKLSVYAEQAARNIQDAFADFLFDPLEKGFDGLLLQFGDILRRMIAELIASKLLEYIRGAFTQTGGSGGGLLGIFTQAAGVFGGFRATGGPVTAGTPYIVGERGPELFVPTVSGNVEPRVPGSDITVNMIESPDRGGEVNRRNNGGRQEIDVFVSDIRGDGPRSRAMQETFGLSRRGL